MASERVIAGLSCGDVLARLGDYLDGELSPEALSALQAHVAGCDACERFGGAYAAVVRALGGAPAPGGLDERAIASIVDRAGR